MAAFEGGSSHTPNPDFKQRLAATLAQDLKPSSLRAQPFKPAETKRDTDSSGSSLPSHHVTLASIKAARMNYNRLESTAVLKPETQESHVPSFPILSHQRIKLPLAQQRLTDRDGGVGNITSAKPLKLPEMKNYIRTCGTHAKVQRESSDPSVPKKKLPRVLVLGSPPPKPQRPPSVDIRRFRRSLTCINDGPGMKIPLPVAPPPIPPRRPPCPFFNDTAALNQELDVDESYDDVGTMNPPPLPLEEHPSKRTEADLSDDMYVEIYDEWMGEAEKSKKHQESNSGKEDASHGKVTEEKQAGPKGAIVSGEMTGRDIKAKKAKKKFKTKGPVRLAKKEKALVDFKGGKSDLYLNQGEVIEVIHNTGHVDLKEEEEEAWPMIYQSEAEPGVYDDIGAPAEVFSGLNVQNIEEDDAYVEVYDPGQRVSPLPQPNDGDDDDDDDDDYEDVDYENVDYDDIKKDSIYEIE